MAVAWELVLELLHANRYTNFATCAWFGGSNSYQSSYRSILGTHHKFQGIADYYDYFCYYFVVGMMGVYSNTNTDLLFFYYRILFGLSNHYMTHSFAPYLFDSQEDGFWSKHHNYNPVSGSQHLQYIC